MGLIKFFSTLNFLHKSGINSYFTCFSSLKSAKLKVDKIIAQPDGDFTSEPYEDD